MRATFDDQLAELAAANESFTFLLAMLAAAGKPGRGSAHVRPDRLLTPSLRRFARCSLDGLSRCYCAKRRDLVATMKANPGKVTFVDQNAAARVTGILMQKATGTEILFIPYRGAGPAMQAMLAQQVDLMVVQAAVTLPQARAGAVKILANLSPARSSVIPTVPTSEESGIPGLYASGWFGLFAPRGTPKEVIARLNAAMVHALADPTVKTRFADLGLDMATREQQTPEGLAAFNKAEIEKWWPIIKAAGIKSE